MDEIGAPWLANGNIIDPHGVVSDLNGNLYSAQIDGPANSNEENFLYQLSCAGEVLDDNYIPNWNRTLNLVTVGNTIYGIGGDYPNNYYPFYVYAYDLCTQTPIDSIQLPDNAAGNNVNGWDLKKGLDGEIYFTQAYSLNVGENHQIYRVEPDLSSYTLIVDQPYVTGFATHGVAQDEFGNF